MTFLPDKVSSAIYHFQRAAASVPVWQRQWDDSGVCVRGFISCSSAIYVRLKGGRGDCCLLVNTLITSAGTVCCVAVAAAEE